MPEAGAGGGRIGYASGRIGAGRGAARIGAGCPGRVLDAGRPLPLHLTYAATPTRGVGGEPMTTTDYAPAVAEARRRARYYHGQALAADRAGRTTDAEVHRLAAAAARATAARLEVIA